MLKPGFVADNLDVLAKLAARTQALCGGRRVRRPGPRPLQRRRGVRRTVRSSARIASGCCRTTRCSTRPATSRRVTTSDPLELYVIGGVKVGISICEDIWSPFGALAEQAAAGAELNININGSPFSIGKGAVRERMLATRAADSHCAIVYVNQVGGQDELVFDGASLVFDHEGTLLARGDTVRRRTADRRRADPAGVPQAAARSAWPGDARAAADGRRVGRHRSCRATPPHGTIAPAVRRRPRAVRRARARHPRLLRARTASPTS